jgi:truncated hemoglobin YjbI
MSDDSSEKITEQLEGLEIEKKDSIELDINQLDFDKLIGLISEYSQAEKILAYSKTVENIKSIFYTRIRKEKSIIFDKHIEEGGTEENFEYTHSSEESFKKAYQNFKSIRNKERKDLEKNQEENLKIKLDIIEKIKELINGTETIKTTFDQFNELQTKWRETGHTPIKANNDLWNSYHHNIEKFYDYININRELRDLDFKRNLEKKTEICIKAEALIKEKSINKSHKELQLLHESWKEIGPVEKEKREEIWQRFKDATHTLNKKRNEHFLELKTKNAENAKLKNEISSQIADLSNLETKEHKAWVELSEKVKVLESKWKSIGKLDKTENKKAWNDFREALNQFYSHKNNFYKTKKEDYKKAVEEKENLCLKVEKLIDSKEWKNTSTKIIKLQEDWKKTSFVPRKQSDALWNRFRTACDTFFNNKKNFFDQLDKEKEDNYKTKSNLLKSLKEYSFGKNKEENLKKIDAISKNWNKIGDVPKKNQKIESEFYSKINSIYKELKIDLNEIEDIKFKNKLEAFKASPDSKRMENEKNYIRTKISEIKKEINQYENNISFFGNSKGAEPLKKQVQDKIDTKVKEINSFKVKLKMLNTI